METVLVIGSTGNVGVSAVSGALRSGRHVLAVVRNEASAEKLFKHVGTREGITVATADVLSEHGVQGVVDQVRAGKLPAFQHVYATVGTWNPVSPMQKLETASFRETMNIALEANFFAYRATIPYLIEQNDPNATWTLMTGGAGELGLGGVTAIGQGALFSMANAACRELADTNVRFNEVYLNLRVDYDSVAEKDGSYKASDFGKNYAALLANKNIRGSRVTILTRDDITDLKHKDKLADVPWYN